MTRRGALTSGNLIAIGAERSAKLVLDNLVAAGLIDHDAYRAGVRLRHGRKGAFWSVAGRIRRRRSALPADRSLAPVGELR